MDVSTWLRDLGLENYLQAFNAHNINAEMLPRLTADDLTALGITSVGHRSKILGAIAALDQRAREPERRQLTVLFCDLVGSTELSAGLDPEDLREVMRAYKAACANVVCRFEGQLARFLGDGVLAYFGWPWAHEDDAERAVRAGLQLVHDVARLEPGAEVRLQARVGVATGHVVVGDDLISESISDRDVVSGDTPNLAARLQALAAPGSVVISPSTRRLVGGLFELADLGPQRLKGFAEPLTAWRVEGEGQAEGRFEARQTAGLTPLIGREEELALLLRRWRQIADGEGQVVLLSGEPGIGKSRLVRELRGRLENEAHIRMLCQCSPHHTTSPLHPVIEQLERAAGFERDDPPEARLAKLEALLAHGTDKPDEAVSLVAALFGIAGGTRHPLPEMTPQRQKQRTLEVLVEQLEGLSAEQPVLLTYEDVHWIDPTTQELLRLAIERIQRLPVLAIVTFRPEFSPPWSGQPHMSALALTRLGRREGALMVDRVAGAKALPAEVIARIVAKTDGVPLFVEELTKTVLESGALEDAGDHYELTGRVQPLAIPSTLRDSLLARLDRLGSAKKVAQIGAAIGHEFPYVLLAAIAEQPEALQAALDQLVASELVFCRGAPPKATYCFKHALIHEVAYGTLLRSRRQNLHARIVNVLEQQPSHTAASQLERLAYHCTHAGEIEKAVKYLHWVGRRAMAGPVLDEAAALLTQALEQLADLPSGDARVEFGLLINLGAVLVATKGLAAREVERVLARARELRPDEDPNPQLLSALNHLFLYHLDRSSNEDARQIAEKIVLLAEEQEDEEMEIVGHHCMAISLFSNGQFAFALKRFKNSLTSRARHIRVACFLFRALILLIQGYPDKALAAREDGQDAAQRLHSDLRREALYLTGWFHQVCRESQAVEAQAVALLELARLHDWAVGDGGGAEANLDELLERLKAVKYGYVQQYTPGFLGLLAELYMEMKDFGEALKLLKQGLARVGRLEERWFESELHRLKGETLLGLATGNSKEAEDCFGQALAVARKQGARLWELRAATSLARLWRDQGKYAEAGGLLAPVYGWFTEGFDTADLKDAKALLDELG